MLLPPPTYALLLGPTLLFVPFLARLAKDASARRTVRRALLGLSLVWLALALLFYSRLACWPLATVGMGVLASAARRRGVASWAPATLAATAAGLVFQFTPGEHGFLAYFAFGLPLSLALASAPVLARWLRWDSSRSTAFAAGAWSLLAGAFVPAAFAFDFLRLYEVATLGVLLAAAAGLAWLVAAVEPARNRGLDASRAVACVGDYVARPLPPWRGLRNGALIAAAAVAASAHLTILSLGPLPWTTGVGLGLCVVGPATLFHRKWTMPPLAGSLLVFAAALAASLPGIRHAYLDAPGPPLALGLALTGVAATLSAWSLATSWAIHVDIHRRTRLARPHGRDHAPASLVVPQPEVPSVAEAERALATAGGDGPVILEMRAPRDPFWTLPTSLYAWLLQPRPRAVHVRILDADAVYVLPPLVPEEFDG